MTFKDKIWRREKRGQLFFALLLAVSFSPCARSQSKLYLSGGIANVLGSSSNIVIGSDIDELFRLKYPVIDLEYEKRVTGSINFVTGLSYFNAGFKTDNSSFSSATDFKAHYVAIPLLIRWNVANKNIVFFDFGAAPFYLIKADLQETIIRFGNPVTVSGDITEYSNRFYFGYKFQMIVPVGRFFFGFFLFSPVKGQSTLKNLEDHWGLSAQQSTYLLANGFSDFKMSGIKVGVRIK